MQRLFPTSTLRRVPETPAGGDPPRPERGRRSGKRAAEAGRTPEADVMHPTHGCCGRESLGFLPLCVGTERLSLWHTSSAGGSHLRATFGLSNCSALALSGCQRLF